MTLLEEIPSFPEKARSILENQYGIESAEAFYVHAVKDAEGLRAALQISQPKLEKLVHLMEGCLSPDYVRRSRQPATKHLRRVILD